jgi:hypothetical protein
VTPLHIAFNALAAAVALVAWSTGSPWAQFASHWVAGLVFIVLVGCCVRLASLALESPPALAAAAKEGPS